MAVVNFAVTKPFEQKINRAIKEQGFASKAEFFRFVALIYLNRSLETKLTDTEEEKFLAAVRSLKRTIRQKIDFKKLPSLQEQLADLR